jgi:threonyl-tRNA synthetase
MASSKSGSQRETLRKFSAQCLQHSGASSARQNHREQTPPTSSAWKRDYCTDNIHGKIQRAEQMRVRTMFVIGKRDMEADAVSVRVHGKSNLSAKPRSEAVAVILQSIKERHG